MSCRCHNAAAPLGYVPTVSANQRNLGYVPTRVFAERNLGAISVDQMNKVRSSIAQLEADQSALENDLSVLVASGGTTTALDPLVTQTSNALVDLESAAQGIGDEALLGWQSQAASLSAAIRTLRAQVAAEQSKRTSGSVLRAVLIGSSAVLAAGVLVATVGLRGRSQSRRRV